MTSPRASTMPGAAKPCGSMRRAEIVTYDVNEVAPYINWSYFFHAWGLRGAALRSQTRDELLGDARRLLAEMQGKARPQGLFRLCTAWAEGDDIVADGTRIPLLRQQEPHADGSPLLCLSDFVRPAHLGGDDRVGFFATTVRTDLAFPEDPYKDMLLNTLLDRLAEAATELMHAHIRREAWGYARDERLGIDDLLACRYTGIRPAVGYPCLPDMSINFILDHILNMCRIGISLTENGAMRPHGSVSGMMLAHRESRYFSVGHIGEDQLCDYARRRGIAVARMRQYLAALL